jgi:hypothetical protein
MVVALAAAVILCDLTAACNRSAGAAVGAATASAGAGDDADATVRQQALDLAKAAHTLTPALSNAEFIRNQIARANGSARPAGWRVQRYDPETFVVTFTYLVSAAGGGEVYPFPFEVKVNQSSVRYILGDAALERKYDDTWSSGTNR